MQYAFEQIFGTIGLMFRIAPFMLAFVATILTLAPEKLRKSFLAQDADGKRMVTWFGLGLLTLSPFVPSVMGSIATISLGSLMLMLGAVVWLDDKITDVIMHRYMAFIYTPLAIYLFIMGPGYGNLGLSFDANLYGLFELVLPTMIASLFVSMLVFSMLSQSFKDHVLPQDGNGWHFILVGAIGFAVTVPNHNPITMIALGAITSAFMYMGALIALPDWTTDFLLKKVFGILYLIASGLSFWILF